ncbi:UPF0158 family protein [Nocardioides sp.]|uniref:UPF0158 family protein n=1 Tax=Nocardioides sp. TaxID=35761 RepID=UPI0027260C6A|nr:UPF0158 family protein [Nocardioides sp.]MDO9455688.1 UPF0158 family protein [Nocardioides sp.]
MTVPLDRIDLPMLAEAIDDGSWEHEHYLDPASGEQYLGAMGEVLDADGEVADPDELGWLQVEGDGSRRPYRDMEVFAAALADRRLGERLDEALEGKGAFRRFRDTLHRHVDVTVLRSWQAFTGARAQLRALDWLGLKEVVDENDLVAARAQQDEVVLAALREVGAPLSSARLVLVNGMPGSGKSTLAERYRCEHPGVLVVEADVLRTWIGGDPADHAEASRHLSLALARAHLEAGYDVVVPQLVARLDQLERFVQVADEAGAELVEVVLHGGVVESRVPDEAIDHLLDYAHGLADVLEQRPGTHRIVTRPGERDSAYRDLLDLLDPDVPA